METERPVPALEVVPCGVCGGAVAGTYCPGCGEPRPAEASDRIGPVVLEAAREATSVDGKLWRSLGALFVPGRLTQAYFRGRRGAYLRPFRLFLLLNVVLFFALGFLQQNPLVGELEMQRQSLGSWADTMVSERFEGWGGNAEVFEVLFNGRARTLASSLIGLLVPMLAVSLAAVYGWGRGARHVVFAAHVVSVQIVVYLAVVGALLALVAGGGPSASRPAR